MVKRCFNGQCVDHPEECVCTVCKNARIAEGYSVTTEQGMFGDLASEYGLKNHSERDAE